MSGSTAPYLALITSEHALAPNFVSVINTLTQGSADEQVVLQAMPQGYDLDTAVGVQLDSVGLWIGKTRAVSEPITDVYFAFDTVGLGFDQGTWFGPFNPISEIVLLPDDAFRTLLRASAAANAWNGSIPDAYRVWDIFFAGTGFTIGIVDNQDMTMDLVLFGPAPDALTLALLEGGYLNLVPAGVGVAHYIIPSVPDSPLFGFGLDNSAIAGFGTGVWADYLT